jgi:enoyl-CoA hydratase/carnithine racemase
MDFENILFSVGDGLAIITLNQPDRRNALSWEMAKEIETALSEIKEKEEAKVLILTGNGKSFCSGGDVKSMAEGMGKPLLESREQIISYYKTALAILRTDIPTIASINGHAIGAGLTLALACDMRIAAEEAKMGATFLQIGLHPGMGTTYFLPRLVGTARACELIFTARMIEAREAERIGLVNKVVPRERLADETKELAKEIAAGPSLAIKMAKKSIYFGVNNDLENVLQYESFAQAACTQTEDLKEGIAAFIQKRKPEFKGK